MLAPAVVPWLWVWGCHPENAPSTGSRPNVLLITVDTLRADRVGCYGYGPARTPAIDQLARSGIRFTRAFTHVPLTLPAHASLLSGRLPHQTGVRVNGMVVPKELDTLGTLLGTAGYRTAAFVSAAVLDRGYGLDQGFDVYDDDLGDSSTQTWSEDHGERSGQRTVARAIDWMGAKSNRPYFAWVHLFEPHAPYDPPEVCRADASTDYDGEIACTDRAVARLLTFLEQSGGRDRTMIWFIGDHGEGLGDHGEAQHGLFLYNSTLHVPWIISWPVRLASGEVREDIVGLTDFLPTVLALVGVVVKPTGRDAPYPGRNLFARNGNEVGSKPPSTSLPGILVESEYAWRGFGWSPLYGWVTERWKYVETPKAELFDLFADPGEEVNLIDTESDRAKAMQMMFHEALSRDRHDARMVTRDDVRAIDRIASLGYVGTGRMGPTDGPVAIGRDPKEMLAVYDAFTEALGNVVAHRFASAAESLEQLLVLSPESVEMVGTLGTAYLRLGRFQEAVEVFERALAANADDPRNRTGLAEALRSSGRTEEALPQYRRVLERSPGWGPARIGLASSLTQLGLLTEALPVWEQCAREEPGSSHVLANLGSVRLALHRPEEAIPPLKEAVEADQDNEFAYRSLWQALATTQRVGEALQVLRLANDRFADRPHFVCPLARLLTDPATQPAEANAEVLVVAEQCTRLAPDNPYGWESLAAVLARMDRWRQAAAAAERGSTEAREAGNADLAGKLVEQAVGFRKRERPPP